MPAPNPPVLFVVSRHSYARVLFVFLGLLDRSPAAPRKDETNRIQCFFPSPRLYRWSRRVFALVPTLLGGGGGPWFHLLPGEACSPGFPRSQLCNSPTPICFRVAHDVVTTLVSLLFGFKSICKRFLRFASPRSWRVLFSSPRSKNLGLSCLGRSPQPVHSASVYWPDVARFCGVLCPSAFSPPPVLSPKSPVGHFQWHVSAP